MGITSTELNPKKVEDNSECTIDSYDNGTCPLNATRDSIKLYPTSFPFINGLAHSYEDDFPPELLGIVPEEAFEAAINQINNTLTDYWPCLFCFVSGYACCLCTLGLSLLCPNLCITDAEGYTLDLIERINKRQCFRDACVDWKLRKTCGRSWVEITFPNQTTKEDPKTMPYQTLHQPTKQTLTGYGSNIVESNI